MYTHKYTHVYTYIYIYIYIERERDIYIYREREIYVCISFFVGSETSANPYTSSFISLGLVYPLPQPLISNWPRQCRKSAKGRHPVLKSYSGRAHTK